MDSFEIMFVLFLHDDERHLNNRLWDSWDKIYDFYRFKILYILTEHDLPRREIIYVFKDDSYFSLITPIGPCNAESGWNLFL